MAEKPGCSCGDPWRDLPPELRPEAKAKKESTLHEVSCRGCGRVFWTEGRRNTASIARGGQEVKAAQLIRRFLPLFLIAMLYSDDDQPQGRGDH